MSALIQIERYRVSNSIAYFVDGIWNQRVWESSACLLSVGENVILTSGMSSGTWKGSKVLDVWRKFIRFFFVSDQRVKRGAQEFQGNFFSALFSLVIEIFYLTHFLPFPSTTATVSCNHILCWCSFQNVNALLEFSFHYFYLFSLSFSRHFSAQKLSFSLFRLLRDHCEINKFCYFLWGCFALVCF